MREAQNAIKLHLDELEKTVAERNAKLIESNELLKSELAERKHAVCDNVPDLLWAKDLEGNAIFVNKAVLFKLKNSANSDRNLGIFRGSRVLPSRRPQNLPAGNKAGRSNTWRRKMLSPYRLDRYAAYR